MHTCQPACEKQDGGQAWLILGRVRVVGSLVGGSMEEALPPGAERARAHVPLLLPAGRVPVPTCPCLDL